MDPYLDEINDHVVVEFFQFEIILLSIPQTIYEQFLHDSFCQKITKLNCELIKLCKSLSYKKELIKYLWNWHL